MSLLPKMSLAPALVQEAWRAFDRAGGRSLFVFGQAAQKPFGTLSDSQKQKAGALSLEAYRDGR